VSETPAVQPRRRYRTILFRGYLIIAILVFVVLALLARDIAYFTVDVTITRFIQDVASSGFGALLYALSWVGYMPQTVLITVAIIGAVYAGGWKWESVVLALSVMGSGALTLILKTVIGRPRPTVDLVNVLAQFSSYSFPSGHVLYFTTFFGFVLFLAFVLLERSWWRTVALLGLGGMIALIGVSRIYQGEHWASDVLGAYLLGSVWLYGSTVIYRWGKRRRFFARAPGTQA
jgi:undecaprenyl-diphosphatase